MLNDYDKFVQVTFMPNPESKVIRVKNALAINDTLFWASDARMRVPFKKSD
jgi:hypothetical protein